MQIRHYEIVVLLHPDQAGQVTSIIDNYKKVITEHKGVIHRLEDCGRQNLAYPINKLKKAHFLVLNIEANDALMQELEHSFKYNETILRHLTTVRKDAVTKPSIFLRKTQDATQDPAATVTNRGGYVQKDSISISQPHAANHDTVVHANIAVGVDNE